MDLLLTRIYIFYEGDICQVGDSEVSGKNRHYITLPNIHVQ